MKKLILSLVLSIPLFFISCKKDLTAVNAPANYTGNNFNDIFEGFWNGMNNNYVFWSIDTTNWDRVYTTYKPLFAKLNLYDENDLRTSVEYFREMVAGLIDSHYNISFPGAPVIGDSSVDPAFERKLRTPGYHNPIPLGYFYYTLPQNYLDTGYLRGVDSTNTSGLDVVVNGTIHNNILYFYFNAFELQTLFHTPQSPANPAIQRFLSQLTRPPAGLRGIIIDVRSNGGGTVNDLNFLVGRMIGKPLTFGYTRAKNGNGRLDYTPWAPAIVTPQGGAAGISVPIIMLADNFSVSMAEITTLAVKTLPNGKFVGETTWGANGPLAPSVYFNGGQFTVGSIIPVSVYTSSTMFKYINGEIYEGRGVPPDYPVPYNLGAFQRGVDQQLEKAISLIP